MNLEIRNHRSEVGGKSLTIASDPHLWPLSHMLYAPLPLTPLSAEEGNKPSLTVGLTPRRSMRMLSLAPSPSGREDRNAPRSDHFLTTVIFTSDGYWRE